MTDNNNSNVNKSAELDDNELESVSGGVLRMDIDQEALKKLNKDSEKLMDIINSSQSSSQNSSHTGGVVRDLLNDSANLNKTPSTEDITNALNKFARSR